jgi:ribonuclease P/MRP protein subunit RPP40
MAAGIDDRIWKLQYGFRGKRSTAQAMFITRRLQDIVERSGEKMTMIFLDWEKAFDKVFQDELINAVRRMNIPEKVLNILKTFYENPRFRIKDRQGKSSWRKQRTGIRQGCPLSPYLFVIFMTVLFNDVEKEVGTQVMQNCMDVVDFSNILYADDTFLVGKRSKELNKILWAIEKHSARYGMKLNRGKCVCINMGVRNVIRFKNGEK